MQLGLKTFDALVVDDDKLIRKLLLDVLDHFALAESTSRPTGTTSSNLLRKEPIDFMMRKPAGILDDDGMYAIALDPIQKGGEARACLDRVRA